MKNFALLFVPAVLAVPSSHAVIGTLLPNSELPDYVCVLKAEKRIDTREFRGKKTHKTTSNDPFCSAVLTGTNTLLSAAHCHPSQVARMIAEGPDGKTSTRLEGTITAQCGKSGTTIRTLTPHQGFPNPMFRVDPQMPHSKADRTFDLSVWKFQDSIQTIAPIRVATTFERTLDIIKTGAKTCRSFGYGFTNDGTHGTLTGALTPITAMSARVIISDLLPDDQGNRVDGGSTAPGDSGGALVCRTPEGQDELVGIVSRGNSDFAPGAAVTTDLSIYSLPSFNHAWIERAESDSIDAVDYARAECLKVATEARTHVEKYSDALLADGKLESYRKAVTAETARLHEKHLSLEKLLEIYDRLYFISNETVRKGRQSL